jgi:TonB-dependent starch-binding outer membrane protein SusC
MYRTQLMSLILLMTSITQVVAASSDVLEKEVSINLLNQPMQQVLKSLEAVAEIRFMYSPNQVNIDEVVSVQVQKRKLRFVLEELFSPRNIRFRVHEGTNTITLNKEAERNDRIPEKKLPKEENRQRVNGKVTDATNGSPMAGVNIIVKGTTQGTTSDAEGAYSLEVQPEDVLIFSFIGFQPIEIQVGNQTSIDVQLTEDIQSLKEVVVNAGYYKVKEREQTGNIAKLEAGEIEKQPVNNPFQALQGRMAGVYIQQESGVPGGAFNIQIRGQNSLRNVFNNNGNRPLYVVDGVPIIADPPGSSASASIIDGGNPLSTINPADIESIEILKDADATAIYGSRGANGVVLITTKRSGTSQTELTAKYSEGWGNVGARIDLLTTAQYLEMRREAFANDGMIPGTLAADHDLLTWDTTRYTDWQRELLGGTARMTNAQLSLAGGTSQTRFLIGGAYLRESTVFPGSFANRKLSGNFKINHESTNKKWKIDFSTYYAADNNDLPRIDLTPAALSLAPHAPALYSESGELNWENGTWRNPLAFTRQPFESKASTLLSNTIISYKILPSLELRTNIGYTQIRWDEFSGQPKDSFDPNAAAISSATFGNRNLQTWITEPTIEYKKVVNRGSWTALIGTTFQSNTGSNLNLTASGFSSDALLRNPQAASTILIQSSAKNEYRYSAVFGRFNYTHNEKYLINLTGRRDASSRFGPGNQSANFGAVGAAWIFSAEPWMNTTWLSFGKLRTSYGITGSDQIADYGYIDLWTSAPFTYDGSVGLIPQNLANPDFAWEESKKWELALETSWLKDRLNLNVSYYHHRSGNQLVGVPVPATTGFSNVQANLAAEVRNSGWEMVMTSTNWKRKDFSWTMGANITIPQNELVSFPDLKSSAFAFDYIVGKPLTVVQAFEHQGVNPETGLFQHRDVNGDGQLTPEQDLLGNKSVAQRFFGGIQNTWSWRGWSMDVFVQFVNQTGRNYLNYFYDRPGAAVNQPVWVMDRWQKPGDQATVQQFTQGVGPAAEANLFNNFSDNRVDNASFVRLKNISLRWQVPTTWTQKAGLRSASLFAQGQNLITFTNYKGLDPESQSNSLPPIRMITIGGQLTF